jgi:PKD repeat protein
MVSCVKEPEVDFEIEVLNCTSPYQVKLTNTSNHYQASNWIINGTLNSNENPIVLMQEGELQRVKLVLENRSKVNSLEKSFFPEYYYQTPSSSFTYDYSNCLNHRSVRFINTSSGYIDNYYWEFGDGAISTNKNPQYEYSIDGSYLVKLNVIRCNDTVRFERIVLIDSSLVVPEADFVLEDADYNVGGNEILAGSYVKFVNSSRYAKNYTWIFHDGQTSTAEHGYKLFDFPGEYQVKLNSSCNGLSDSMIKTYNVRYPERMRVNRIEVSNYLWFSTLDIDERPDIYIRLLEKNSVIFNSSVDNNVNENETPSWNLNKTIDDMYDWSGIQVFEKVEGQDVLLSTINFLPVNFFGNGVYSPVIVSSNNGYSVRIEVDWL